MKIFYSEIPAADYDTYTFPYAVYAMAETPDDIPSIYRKGFLPYTDIRFRLPAEPLFYLARSLRVRLDAFVPTSENRRIARKMADLNPRMEAVDKEKLRDDKAFMDFCRAYAAERIGEAMNEERLQYIFEHPLLNKIFVFRGDDGVLGYVWAVDYPPVLHYWFAFFDTRYFDRGIGKWMMERVISYARGKGYEHAYLGTCYGPKALYKVRDFRAVEFFDGEKWSADVKRLKAKCREKAGSGPDEWKRTHRRE